MELHLLLCQELLLLNGNRVLLQQSQRGTSAAFEARVFIPQWDPDREILYGRRDIRVSLLLYFHSYQSSRD